MLRLDGIFEAGYLSPGGNPSSVAHRNGGRLVACTTHMIDISPRVQRLIVRYFPYLPFKVVYKKGTDIPVADALSHVTPMDPEDNTQLQIIAVNMITTQILMSVESQGSFSNKLDQLRKSTVQDEQLTRLKGYISTGFPCDKKHQFLQNFHHDE